ncbi:MAG: hypothetical protein ACRC6Z_03635 [Cetobacterium sp.]
MNIALKNIGELKSFFVIPAIVDAQDYSTKTDKYDSIYDYYFIAKDEKNVIASIQGFMYLLSKHQLFGMDWSDLRAYLFYAGRVVLDNYTVPKGTSQDYNFSQNIKSKLQNEVNSVFVGTHCNPDVTLDETVISIYAPENE